MTSDFENVHLYALDQLIGTGCGLSVVKEKKANTILAGSCLSVGSLLCGGRGGPGVAGRRRVKIRLFVFQLIL